MRVFELRLLLAIILVLLGATVFLGMSLEDNSESVVLQNQTPPSHLNQQEKVLASERPASDLYLSRPTSEAVSRILRVSPDLVLILRC